VRTLTRPEAPAVNGDAPRPDNLLAVIERRWRAPILVAGSLIAAALLVLVLAGRRHEFATAISSVAPAVLALAALGQIVALLARSEAWHLSIEAAGGTVRRRVLYRASSMQVLAAARSAHGSRPLEGPGSGSLPPRGEPHGGLRAGGRALTDRPELAVA